MAGWQIIDNRYPFTHVKPPKSITLERTDHSKRINYVPERTTTRNTKRTVYGNPRPVCERCGYGIGDKRWSYCPKCGAKIVEVDE